MSTISSAITRIENLISGDSTYSGVWARTNRAGSMICRVNGATANTVSVTSLTLGGGYYSGPVQNMHVVRSGVARRITAQPTIGGTGAASLSVVAFSTAPTTGAAALHDGFVKCESSQRIEKNILDRRFQVRMGEPEVLDGYGDGTDRVRQGVDVLVVYQADQLSDEVSLRAIEDFAAIGAVISRRGNMVSGVNVMRAGAADIHEAQEKGAWQIWRFPFHAIYYRTIRER